MFEVPTCFTSSETWELETNSPSKTLEVVGTIQTDELCLGTDCCLHGQQALVPQKRISLKQNPREPPSPTNPQEITDENAFQIL